MAGLAPLVSLSALAAGWMAYPHARISSHSSQQMAAAVFQAVAPLFISASDSTSSASLQNSHAHDFLNLQALIATPFSGSLYLLASFAAVDLLARRHQSPLLRC